MAMARDGLLPSFFSDISERTLVPLKSTITTGIFAASLAFFMDVSQLAGMVSGLMCINLGELRGRSHLCVMQIESLFSQFDFIYFPVLWGFR